MGKFLKASEIGKALMLPVAVMPVAAFCFV